MRGRADAARPESERIDFLLRRDGPAATRAWVERTVRIYQAAVADPRGHASDPFYRPLFERAIEEFHGWLRDDDSGPRDDSSSPEGSRAPGVGPS